MLLQIRRLFLSSAVSLFLCARMVLFFCIACIYAKLELLYLGLRDILRVAREKRFQERILPNLMRAERRFSLMTREIAVMKKSHFDSSVLLKIIPV